MLGRPRCKHDQFFDNHVYFEFPDREVHESIYSKEQSFRTIVGLDSHGYPGEGFHVPLLFTMGPHGDEPSSR